jgi:hypothetical protein
MLKFDIASLSARPLPVTRPAGDPASARTARIRVTGLPAATVTFDRSGAPQGMRRFWVYTDDGDTGTAGARLRLPTASASFWRQLFGVSANSSEEEPLLPGVSAEMFQNAPDGVVSLAVRPGDRGVYVSSEYLPDPLHALPIPTDPLPATMRYYPAPVGDGQTVDVDASELFHTLFVAPTLSPDTSVATGLLALVGVPEGYSLWLADDLATTAGYERDAGLRRVGVSGGPGLGQAALAAKVGTWGSDPARVQLEVRSPDGALRVPYRAPFTVTRGETTTISFVAALAAVVPFAFLARRLPAYWTMEVDGVAASVDAAAHTGRGPASIGSHRVRFVMPMRPDVVTRTQTLSLVDQDVAIDAGVEIAMASIALRQAGRLDDANAIDATLRGERPPQVSALASAARILGMPHGGRVFTGATLIPDGTARWEDSTYQRWLVPLAPGAQRLTVEDATGARRVADVTVVAGVTTDVDWSRMTPVATRGRIALRGAPSTWPLHLDGEGGEGGVDVSKLAQVLPGRHVVDIQPPGGAPLTRTVEVVAGETVTADFTALVAALTAPGRVRLVGAPETWPVLLDGVETARSALASVPPGARVVSVRPPTGADLEVSVDVPAGGSVEANFTALVAAIPPPPTGDAATGRILVRNLPDGWRLELARRVTEVRAGQTYTGQMPFAATTAELLSRGLVAGEYAVRATSPDGRRTENRIAFVPVGAGVVELSFAPTDAPVRSGLDLRDVPPGYTVSVTRPDTTPVVPPFALDGAAGTSPALLALQSAGHGRMVVRLTETDAAFRTRVPLIVEGASDPRGNRAPDPCPDRPITTMPLEADVPEGAVVVVSVGRALTLATAEEEARRVGACSASQAVTGTVVVTGIPRASQGVSLVLRAPLVMREGRQVRSATWEYPLTMGVSTTDPLRVNGRDFGRGVDMSGEGPASASAAVPQGFYTLDVAETNLPLGTCSPVNGQPSTDPRCVLWASASIEVRVGATTTVPWSDLAALHPAVERTGQQPLVPGQPGLELKIDEALPFPALLGTYPSGTVTVRGVPRGWVAGVAQQVPPGGASFGRTAVDGALVFDLTGSGQLTVGNKLAPPQALGLARSVSAGDSVEVGRAIADLVYVPGAQRLGLGITSILPDGRKAGFLAPTMARLASDLLEPGLFGREVSELDAVAVRPEHVASLGGKIPTVLYTPSLGFVCYPLTQAQIDEARRSVAGASFGDEAFLGVSASTIAKGVGVTVGVGGVAAAGYYVWSTWFRGAR